MKLNIKNYKAILAEKQLSDEYVRKATGLSEKKYQWIMDRGFVENETLDMIVDAVGCKFSDILGSDYEGYSENIIEWVKDGKTATLSLSQRRIISRVKKLAEKYPEKIQILSENKDGSLYAHIPVDWVKIAPLARRTESQREASRRNMEKIRQSDE